MEAFNGMILNWTYNENDIKAANELQNNLPDRIFDIHAHL